MSHALTSTAEGGEETASSDTEAVCPSSSSQRTPKSHKKEDLLQDEQQGIT